MPAKTLERWLAMMATGDFRELSEIVAASAIYHSPVEWHPYPGRELVCLLVRTAANVLEDFKYQRRFTDQVSAALEFTAHVGHEPLRGVHLLRFNVEGEITEIDLIARPARGVMALGNAIGARAATRIKSMMPA